MKPPFDGPLDLVSGQPDDGGMDARVTKLEADVTTIKMDVAVIKANGATKSDVADVRTEMRSGFAEIRAEMRSGFAQIRAEISAEFAAVRAETQAESAAVRAEMRSEFAAVRAEMRSEFAAVRAEMHAQGKGVETLIAKGHTRIIMWVGGFIFLAQLLPILKDMVDEPRAGESLRSQAAPTLPRDPSFPLQRWQRPTAQEPLKILAVR